MQRHRRRPATWIRVLAVASALILSGAACTSFAAVVRCAVPPLVIATGDPLLGNTAIQLWQPDGRMQVLSADPAAEQPAVSPDGRTVAFALGEGVWSDGLGYLKSRVAILSVGTRDVSVVSADIPLTTVANLQWSHDGSQVAFVRWGMDVREIVSVDVENRRERRLLTLAEGSIYPSFGWSADGAELLVSAWDDESAASGLRRYSVATGEYVEVPSPHTLIGGIAWSPAGRLVAMEANIPGTDRTRLFVLDLETGSSQPVDRRGGAVRSMTWSGPYLVYTYLIRAPDEAVVLMTWNSSTGERVQGNSPGLDTLNSFARISAPGCAG
jgi:Tol biopolymer transport system component